MIKTSHCKRLRVVSFVCLALIVCGASNIVRAAQGGPVLLSDASSTRAIALESVTMKREPFGVNSTVAFNSTDHRTRIMLFVMNIGLLQGEGVNALSAEMQDAASNTYPLTVEFAAPVPGFEWISEVIVRLNDNTPADPGDMLVRLNIHGVSSNRVRVAIGHVGGGPADDPGSIATPAPSTPPAPTPTPTPNPYPAGASVTDPDAVRFLEQATFGPTQADLAHLRAVGFRNWLNEQYGLTASSYPAFAVFPDNSDNAGGCTQTDSTQKAVCLRDNYSMYPLQNRFYTNALYSPDQLRQRVSFALMQIMVVSGRDIYEPSWMAPYLQTFDRNAFGNFRTLLGEITLNPAMGRYLDMAGNSKTAPNENYAREVLQLFSVGLYKLNLDGTLQLDSQGNPIPTYDQTTITNFARVFTGWNIAVAPSPPNPQGAHDYLNPMTLNANNHDTGSKTLLNGAVNPAGSSTTQYAVADLNAALDNIFNHPNVGPFICKQLIQHLVTSNPSPAYVARVAAVFNNNGQGVRGDLKAVVTAILLDPEARGDVKDDPKYGHLREPALFITSILRAYNAKSADGTTNSDGYLNGYPDNANLTNGIPGSQVLDQNIFKPPTVFNFYSPDYGVPGTTLYGPEFEILSTTTALKRANFVNAIIFSTIPTSTDRVNGVAPNGTSIDLVTTLQPLATDPNNPAPLLDALNNLLMHGTMSAQMRSTITTALQSVPGTDSASALKRARYALYLVATSSQYQVER